MKTEFLKPRFAGPRSDQHTLPVEVARDLAAYEELVIEVAKHLYSQSHEGRQRVPKGFEKEFSLHLERVDDGSAKPLLSWVAAAGLLLPGGGHGPFFEQARDVIAECVQAAAEDQPLPAAFPKHLLDYFHAYPVGCPNWAFPHFAGGKSWGLGCSRRPGGTGGFWTGKRG